MKRHTKRRSSGVLAGGNTACALLITSAASRALDSATLMRFTSYRKPTSRAPSATRPMLKITTFASWPWKRSTVPTLTPSGTAALSLGRTRGVPLRHRFDEGASWSRGRKPTTTSPPTTKWPRIAVAKQRRTPLGVLKILAADDNVKVRKAVHANRSATDEIKAIAALIGVK